LVDISNFLTISNGFESFLPVSTNIEFVRRLRVLNEKFDNIGQNC